MFGLSSRSQVAAPSHYGRAIARVKQKLITVSSVQYFDSKMSAAAKSAIFIVGAKRTPFGTALFSIYVQVAVTIELLT